MENFQHFLLTRINVDWGISKPLSQEKRNSSEFLDHRFSIFEKTCYPSVQSQNNKNFIWLILCDGILSDIYRKRIESYNSNIRIIPVYVTSKDKFLDTIAQVIASNLLNSTRYLITTNLDSDDIIAKNFIATLQNQFNQQNFEFINFPFGYLYNFNSQTLFLREWDTAPCHTLIEQIKEHNKFDTALKYSHISINQYSIRQVIMKPMWLMTVHGQNVRTRFDINAAWQPLFRLDNNFVADIDYPKKSLWDNFKEIFSAIQSVAFSKKKWDTPKTKFKKILDIFFPSLIRISKKIKMMIST